MRQVTHVTLDDREIRPEEWARYDEAMERWRERYKDNPRSMEAAMSEPNPPNYYRANND